MYSLRRALAFAVDAGVVWLTIAAVSQLGVSAVALNASLYLAYRGVFGAIGPATLGRAVLDLHLTTLDGSRPTLSQCLLREIPVALVLLAPLLAAVGGSPDGLLFGLVVLFSLGPLVLGLDLALVWARRDGRGWRDLVAGTAQRCGSAHVEQLAGAGASMAVGGMFLGASRLAFWFSGKSKPGESGSLKVLSLPVRSELVSQRNRVAGYGLAATGMAMIGYGCFLVVATAVGWEIY